MRLRSISNAVVTLATVGAVVNASPAAHQHGHAHIDKRAIKIVDVPGPVVVEYELNGKKVEKFEVCEGINAGTLKLADEAQSLPECSKEVVQVSQSLELPPQSHTLTPLVTTEASSSAKPTITPPAAVVHDFFKENIKISSTSPIKASSSLKPSLSKALQSNSDAPSLVPSGLSNTQGLHLEFPDGELDCTTFPSEYGPIEVEWAGLDGWSGIQYVTIQGDSVTHIDTAVPGGQGCKPGAMCSYACPAGYQKSQWPMQQGSTGQSVGGIHCNSHGKLVLTNPGLSKQLCIQGTGAVTVQNKLSNNAAICRTDYPGTENEVVPLNTQPDSSSPLTCPDAASYFKHNGDSTSAQYYINNQGVALQNACMWGTDGTDMGNWAPSYLGVGQDISGKTWLSISSTAQNNPKSYKPLNFTVTITGHTSGKCALKDGRYCSGENYEHCNEQGCTVELMSGQATYVLADATNL